MPADMPDREDRLTRRWAQACQENVALKAEIERLKAELAAVPKAEFWWYWNVTDFSHAAVDHSGHSIAEKTRTIQRWFAAMDYTDDEDD